MEYHDRRGQYRWDTLSYTDLVIRHSQYYEMDKEEEERFRMQAQNAKFKITPMGLKSATKAFRKQLDTYLEAHGGDDGIMAPCGCMLTKGWMVQEREIDESTKEEERFGGQDGHVGHGGGPGYGELEGQGVHGEYEGGKDYGTKDPDWDSPAEGIKAGMEYGKDTGKEEGDQDKD